MARSIPPDRFDALMRAATRVFLRQGYRRTQMADVAAELGVAKGTLYLYVESKEALFEQALVHADRADAIPTPRELPVPTPRPGSTLRKVRARIRRDAKLPALSAAVARRAPSDTRAEVDAILRELLSLLSAHRIAIKLLDRCAADFPELARLWTEGGRGGVVSLLEKYLRQRSASGRVAPVVDPVLAARITLEVVAHWAVHRHWDPAPDPRFADDAAVEKGVVEFITRAWMGDLP